jgi:hypothetical protein
VSSIERAKKLGQLWALVMPDTTMPPARTVLIWLASFDDNLIERALMQALHVAEKYQPKTEDDLLKLYKFISARLRIMRENEKEPKEELCPK